MFVVAAGIGTELVEEEASWIERDEDKPGPVGDLATEKRRW